MKNAKNSTRFVLFFEDLIIGVAKLFMIDIPLRAGELRLPRHARYALLKIITGDFAVSEKIFLL